MEDDYGSEMEAIESERLDADLLQAQYVAESNECERLRRRGICQHTSVVGLPADGSIYYAEQRGLKPGMVACTEHTNGCNAVFPDDQWGAMRLAAKRASV